MARRRLGRRLAWGGYGGGWRNAGWGYGGYGGYGGWNGRYYNGCRWGGCGYNGWGWGLATGALLGAAATYPYYYGYPYYGYGYGYGYPYYGASYTHGYDHGCWVYRRTYNRHGHYIGRRLVNVCM